MQRTEIRRITYTGLMAAFVFVATYLFHVPIGMSGGYVHFGDTLVYIAATVLPLPYAMVASAIGAGLSDLMSPGGAIWVLPTILIKPLCCLAFSRRSGKLLCGRNVLALFVAGAITIAGYFVATIFIAGSVAVALAEIPPSLIQPIGSGICFVAAAAALDATGVRKKLGAEGVL